MNREYSDYSPMELRELFLTCDHEYDILMKIIDELQYRSPQIVAYVIKGIHMNQRDDLNISMEPASEKLLQDTLISANKFEIDENKEITFLQIGQEVEDMVVVDIDIERRVFSGKTAEGSIYECDFETWISPKETILRNERLEKSTSQSDPLRVNKSEGEQAQTEKKIIDRNLFSEIDHRNERVGTIRPKGNIKGVPTKREFPLKTEIKINLSEDTSLVVKYEAALTALIKELKSKGGLLQQFVLEEGQQVEVDGQRIGYQFPWDGEAALFEGAQVFISVDDKNTDGRIVAVMERYIIISLSHDIGPYIVSCLVRVDNTAMLEVLRSRFEVIIKGDDPIFNTPLAESVVYNSANEIFTDDESFEIGEKLNIRQAEAVKKMMANEVFYLWGPPGTGKTESLSALNICLLETNKRVLICSNTNQAVDQVLLKLCKKLMEDKERSTLENGLIVRVGKISQELESEWGDYVTIDAIVARKSVDLSKRKVDLENQIAVLSVTITDNQIIVDKFTRLDTLCKEEVALQNKQRYSIKKHKDLLSRKEEMEHLLKKLKDEKVTHSSANQLRRIFLRSEEIIENEIKKASVLCENIMNELHTFETVSSDEKKACAVIQEKISNFKSEVNLFDRKLIETKIDEDNVKKQTLIEEVTEINKKLDEISKSVLDNAKIIGATVTKTFLSKQMFNNIDVVVIDEASMIMLPAVFYASGLAREKVIISGDPRQLSPIVQTDQKAIFDILGKDIFEECGVSSRNKNKAKRFIMLKEQYRMHEKICKLLSSSMYKNQLYTSKDIETSKKIPPEPFNDRLIIVDTSSIGSFDSRDHFKSRYNIMHALAIRNLCLYLNKKNYIIENDHSVVGVCTPYAAQSKVLQKVLQSAGLKEVTAGTVHRYQGDEKMMMILDIADSNTERRVSVFLEADNPKDNGSKLFNVAISRAKSNLVVVANLTYLDKKLPQYAFMRGILSEITKKGKVIDVQKVLSLYPIIEDLKKYGQQFDLSPKSLSTGLFNEKDFHMVCLADIENAKKGVAIFSAFITPQRVATYETVFRRKIQHGVTIRCITRPPNKNGSMSKDDSIAALDSLEKIGCIVDTRNVIHEKAVIIDDEIVWFGSLNALSHTEKTNEMMARIKGNTVAFQIAAFLSLDKGVNLDSAQGLSVKNENPRCPNCGSRVCYNVGKFGPYWSCEKCDWKENVGQWKKEKHVLSISEENAPLCPLCGNKTIPKTGRFGEFYGCCNFPECNGKVKVKNQRLRM